MKFPIGWLREYVDLPFDPKTIADTLAGIGFPVDEIVYRPRLCGIVAGKIATLGKHPNADRLQIATIDVGGTRPLRVATAATNVRPGQVIAVATVGAQLAQIKIERRTMRGFESEGMMCSADELALPAGWFEDGILQLDSNTPLGADVVAHLGLQDEVFDVDITSNRVDVMSIVGLARELAAVNGQTLRFSSELSLNNDGAQSLHAGKTEQSNSEEPLVEIQTPDCNRFIAQRFENVNVGQSPLWMRIRLTLAGQRPINNVVDISNYVMFEIGQPTHFYDALKVDGHALIVRDGHDGETLRTLDGAEYSLTRVAMVIADGNGAQGLAGLMGGSEPQVTFSTRSVILESANFNGGRVRRMSAAIGLRTDASTRHEKALPLLLADFGAARVAALLRTQGAIARMPRTFGKALPREVVIDFAKSEIQRLLGFSLSTATIRRHLGALGFRVLKEHGSRTLRIEVPWWRTDVAISADIVEEIARMVGYARVKSEIPAVRPHSISSKQYDLERKAARAMAALGYHEVMNHSLQSSDPQRRLEQAGLASPGQPLQVRNPLSEDQRYLRFSLGPGLFATFARNREQEPSKLFEFGHVFLEGDAPVEISVMAFAWAGQQRGMLSWHDENFLRFKGDVEYFLHLLTGRKPEIAREKEPGWHPGKCVALLYDGKECAFAGELDLRLAHAYDLQKALYYCTVFLDKLPSYAPVRYETISRFPPTVRDIALVLSTQVTSNVVQTAITGAIGPVAKEVRVFDEYRGPQVPEHKKSLTIRVTMQKNDATMTDAEADSIIGRALEVVGEELGAYIRA